MKNLFRLFILIFLCQNISYAQDTITVKVGSKSKVLIIAEDRDALKNFKKVDVNKILGDVIKGIDEEEEKTEKEEKKVYKYSSEGGLIKITFEKNPSDTISTVKQKPKRFRHYIAVDVGFNSYLEDGSNPATKNKDYGLNIGRSRFVSLGTYRSMKIGKLTSPVSLHFGLEFSWYNFMFENNNYIVRGQTNVEFQNYQQDFEETLSKSKLTVPYVNLPLMLRVGARDKKGNLTFHLGVGGYVGHRVGGHRKVKLENGDKHKERNNFYLNNWRYGVETQFGFRDLTLFIKYDMNDLFNTDTGSPQLNAFAFGIRI